MSLVPMNLNVSSILFISRMIDANYLGQEKFSDDGYYHYGTPTE